MHGGIFLTPYPLFLELCDTTFQLLYTYPAYKISPVIEPCAWEMVAEKNPEYIQHLQKYQKENRIELLL